MPVRVRAKNRRKQMPAYFPPGHVNPELPPTLNSTIEVYWRGTNEFYPGVVSKITGERVVVSYHDGGTENLVLQQQVWQYHKAGKDTTMEQSPSGPRNSDKKVGQQNDVIEGSHGKTTADKDTNMEQSPSGPENSEEKVGQQNDVIEEAHVKTPRKRKKRKTALEQLCEKPFIGSPSGPSKGTRARKKEREELRNVYRNMRANAAKAARMKSVGYNSEDEGEMAIKPNNRGSTVRKGSRTIANATRSLSGSSNEVKMNEKTVIGAEDPSKKKTTGRAEVEPTTNVGYNSEDEGEMAIRPNKQGSAISKGSYKTSSSIGLQSAPLKGMRTIEKTTSMAEVESRAVVGDNSEDEEEMEIRPKKRGCITRKASLTAATAAQSSSEYSIEDEEEMAIRPNTRGSTMQKTSRASSTPVPPLARLSRGARTVGKTRAVVKSSSKKKTTGRAKVKATEDVEDDSEEEVEMAIRPNKRGHLRRKASRMTATAAQSSSEYSSEDEGEMAIRPNTRRSLRRKASRTTATAAQSSSEYSSEDKEEMATGPNKGGSTVRRTCNASLTPVPRLSRLSRGARTVEKTRVGMKNSSKKKTTGKAEGKATTDVEYDDSEDEVEMAIRPTTRSSLTRKASRMTATAAQSSSEYSSEDEGEMAIRPNTRSSLTRKASRTAATAAQSSSEYSSEDEEEMIIGPNKRGSTVRRTCNASLTPVPRLSRLSRGARTVGKTRVRVNNSSKKKTTARAEVEPVRNVNNNNEEMPIMTNRNGSAGSNFSRTNSVAIQPPALPSRDELIRMSWGKRTGRFSKKERDRRAATFPAAVDYNAADEGL